MQPVHLAFVPLIATLTAAQVSAADRFCFPTNMHRTSCDSSGAYIWVQKGELIPCSPVCQLEYRFTNERYISARRIYEVCKYHPEKRMFYHEISDRDRCACRDWAAYERKEDRWINHFNVTWFCNPNWDIKRTEFVGVYAVDCDRQDHLPGICEQDCTNNTLWGPEGAAQSQFLKPKCQPLLV